MKTKIFLAVFLALVAMSLPNYASAGLPEAVTYLKSQASDAWITQALIAAGEINVSVSHLSSVSGNLVTDYAKTILALAAAGENPTTFGNIDYVAKLKTYYNNNQMGSDSLLNDDIWSILALASVKKTGSVEAMAAKNFLRDNQNADGGWGYDVGGASDTNDTAAAIMALIEMGFESSDTVIIKALSYLQSAQNDDGGFTYDPNSIFGTDSDSSSDAWVISAIYKIGQNPVLDAWVKNGNNPLAHMQTLQDAADGGFWWVDPAGNPDFNNKAMTAYSIIALAEKTFPIGYYEIPPSTRLSVNKSTLNSGETVVITVEYFDDQNWLPLVGATVNGLNQSYTADASGQVSVALTSGDYNLSAAKEGFAASNQTNVSVLAPPPPPNGGAIFIAPANCQSVEYDVWQDTCADNWRYRNVLTVMPANCLLTAEQESLRKKACITPRIEANDAPSVITNGENNENDEIKPEVLGVKITEVPAEQLAEAVVEAKQIINGRTEDFVAVGSASTVKLGAGERAGVLNSYKSAFGKAPESEAEWVDVIRISNNELPSPANPTAVNKAKMEFKKVYGREADINNYNDQTALNMITYGLRPEKRDLDSERAGIRVFTEIYKYLPVSALDWDTVRAIAYSGIEI